MRRYLLIAAWVVSFCCVAQGEASTRTTLTGQIHSLASGVKKAFTNDPRLTGQSMQLGKFDGKGDAFKSNFGTRIEQMFREELSGLINENAKYTLTGGYRYVPSDDPTEKDAKVLRLTVRIDDDRDKEVTRIETEINDTDEIFQVLGLTGSPPQKPGTSFLDRNKSAQEAQARPDFELDDKTRVAAKGRPQWSVGILKKTKFNGPSLAATPQNEKGVAFVPIGINEYYEIELANKDTHDAVATITVDGLDVANTFAVDKDSSGKLISWPGYLVPKGQTVVIKGWLHTIDKTAKDNVFSFLVGELGQGAASALKTRGAEGVITVQFRESCAQGEKPTGRSPGETKKGEGLRVGLEAKTVQIGESVLSTVSIRYNRPE